MNEEEIKEMFRKTFGSVIFNCDPDERLLLFKDFLSVATCAGILEQVAAERILLEEKNKIKNYEIQN